jgi:mannose-1-phosphate guanylyltransferase
MDWVLILAGGGGTRLWPASRRRRPKQFLPLLPGGRTLLGATVERLASLAPPERTLIVTAAGQADDVARAAPSVPPANVVIEPEARNTAAAIGLGAVEVLARDPEGVVAVVPSDQFVARGEDYRAALARALAVAAGDRVVTVGIRPTAPETGYGYLELGAPVDEGAFEVARFVEKPDRMTAMRYLESGRYLWNSGMFFFRAARMLDEIRRHLPALGTILDGIAAEPSNRLARAATLYPTAPSISIDFGVAEKLGARELGVVPGDFGWSDVGSWSALGELQPADANGNAALGEHVAVDARGNLLYAAPGRLVAAVGVSDLVIVASDDAVLVLPRERAQDVREVVRALEASKRDPYL